MCTEESRSFHQWRKGELKAGMNEEECSTLTHSSSTPITHLQQTERHLNPEQSNNRTIQMQRRKAKSHYFNSIFSHTLFVLPLTQDVVVGRLSLHFSLFYRLTHMALFSSFCSI